MLAFRIKPGKRLSKNITPLQPIHIPLTFSYEVNRICISLGGAPGLLAEILLRYVVL